jgi:hypothetical protein
VVTGRVWSPRMDGSVESREVRQIGGKEGVVGGCVWDWEAVG